LIEQYLDTEKICPLASEHTSSVFIIFKADLTVFSCWINNYHAPNENTIADAHPLLRVDDILDNCVKEKIWNVINTTNNFFQRRIRSENIHLIVVTTPFGLYEWLVMPIDLKNIYKIWRQF
jgi:hypothetical protein